MKEENGGMKFTLKLLFIGVILISFTNFSNPQTSGLINSRNPDNEFLAQNNTPRVAEEEPSTSLETKAVESQPSASVENTQEAVEEVNSNSQSNQAVQSQPTESSQPAQPSPVQTTDPNQPAGAQPFISNHAAAVGVNTVNSVGFEVKDGVGVVTIKTSAPARYEELPKEERKLSIKIKDVVLPDEFQVSRDVGDFDSPIDFISSFRDPAKPSNVVVIVELKKETPKDSPVDLKQEGDLITASFGKPKKSEKLTEEGQIQQPPKEVPLYAFDFRITTSPGAKKAYRGQPVSFDFKEADVRDVLRVLADVSGLNFVISQDVKGTVTLKLTNVPWDQALDVVLTDTALGALVEGSVIWISPIRSLQARLNEIQQAALSKEQIEPLVTKQIFINYSTGEQLKSLLEPILSKRGELKIDVRTNSILVTDTAPRVAQAEELVKNLDTRTPQVLIESRIVQATLDFTRELGVQWGFNYKASAATGNPTGANFPSTVVAGGVVPGNPGPFGSPGQNFVVDLPAAVGQGAGGAIGVVLGSLTGAFDLDIRLSALEHRGDGRILSSPRVLTLDNQAARIEQGVSIPFLSVSAAGTQTQFVDATLRLEVTPHVTNDGKVLMLIKVTDNAPDPSITGANGQPAIRRNEAESQVLASDGETIVIGGIFTRTTTEDIEGLPWLARIPLLGWLFRHNANIDQRRELIVFISPRIVK
jgi:type IV pilus assembly protein PilQ